MIQLREYELMYELMFTQKFLHATVYRHVLSDGCYIIGVALRTCVPGLARYSASVLRLG